MGHKVAVKVKPQMLKSFLTTSLDIKTVKYILNY